MIFAAARPLLPGRLLFTGYHGDRVWSIAPGYVSDHIVRGDPSGGSLLEFRLSTGFQHLPLPFAGCLNQTDVFAIATSPEMASWSVGGNYDRPIPRRVAETAGVPRHLFGQHKRAASRPYRGTGTVVAPEVFLSPRSMARFREFSVAAGGLERLRSLPEALLVAICGSRLGESYKVARALEAVGIKAIGAFKWRYSKPITAASLLFRCSTGQCGSGDCCTEGRLALETRLAAKATTTGVRRSAADGVTTACTVPRRALGACPTSGA